MPRFPAASTLERQDDAVRRTVAAVFDSLGGETVNEAATALRRRAGPRRRELERQALELRRDADGILRWSIGPPAPRGPGTAAQRRRAGPRRALLPAQPALQQAIFGSLPASTLSSWLLDADKLLSAAAFKAPEKHWGLRVLTPSGQLDSVTPADAAGFGGKRILVWVHGTFSNNDRTLADLEATAAGKGFLAAARSRYDRVVFFDHPTLGSTPVLNAFELAARLPAAPQSIDLVAHSRGGLVVRWFCEAFRPDGVPCRAVLVGSPLAGTSLAAAPRVRQMIDLLANFGAALGAGTGQPGAGLLVLSTTLASFLFRSAGALSSALAETSLALVPGLAAQSRQGLNPELLALRRATGAFNFALTGSPVRYWGIRSDFKPRAEGLWHFVGAFVRRPGTVLADLAADALFGGPNDLVVDTDSMTDTGELEGKHRRIPLAHDFGQSTTVHHLNYFRQPETLASIRRVFGW